MNATNNSTCFSNEGGRQSVGPLSPLNCQLPLPAHKLYVETRGSFGAWLFYKPRSEIEVLNDSDGEAINLSWALMKQREQRMLASAFARPEPGLRLDPELLRALQFGSFIEKASKSVSRSPKDRTRLAPVPVASGLTRLDRAFDRLRGVLIEDGSTAELVRRYDWRRAFFLCDERSRLACSDYAQDLLEALTEASGSIMLVANEHCDLLARSRRFRQLSLSSELTDSVWVNF